MLISPLANLTQLSQQTGAPAGFLAVGLIIFILAVGHTLLASWVGQGLERWHGKAARTKVGVWARKIPLSSWHLLGEVELVFGFWALVLLFVMAWWPGQGFGVAWHYFLTGNYFSPSAGTASKLIEPLFVLVIMTFASTTPVVSGTKRLIVYLANFLGGTVVARWWVTLTITPLLGSCITEPAAMTIAANLLLQDFYPLNPSRALQYATLALLFVNISLGGALTHFAAPPVIMVAGVWGWGTPMIFQKFGTAVLTAIGLSNTLYYFYFRREWATLRANQASVPSPNEAVQLGRLVWYLILMAWTVWAFNHHDIIGLMAGLGVEAAGVVWSHGRIEWRRYQGPALVAVFLAGLVIVGGLQGWWLTPLLSRLDEKGLLVGATLLTAFNDNAAVTYLAAQVPVFAQGDAVGQGLRHAVLAGALAGGGLTVMANAPNPAGLSILKPYFPSGVEPWRLVLWAIVPTLVALGCFILL